MEVMSGNDKYRDQAAQNGGNTRQDDHQLMKCDIRPRKRVGVNFNASVYNMPDRVVRVRTENSWGTAMLGSIFEG